MVEDSIDRLMGAVRDGDAAAVLARGLPASPEGQSVTRWLRRAVAAQDGQRRDRAVRGLRWAVQGHLLRFPGEREGAALDRTLRFFDERFGVDRLAPRDVMASLARWPRCWVLVTRTRMRRSPGSPAWPGAWISSWRSCSVMPGTCWAEAGAGEAQFAVGLVLLAREVYGVDGRWLDRGAVGRLKALVEFLGRVSGEAKPDGYPPDHGELREQVAGLLGMAPSVKVAEVDAAARAVGRYVRKNDGELPDSPAGLKAGLDQLARDELPRLRRKTPTRRARPGGCCGRRAGLAVTKVSPDGSRRVSRPRSDGGRAGGRAGPRGRGARQRGRAAVPARSGTAAAGCSARGRARRSRQSGTGG